MSEPTPTLGVQCPVCQAKTGERCTVPTITGRREVSWIHSGRIEVVSPPKGPIETLAETLLTTLQGDETVTMITCDCGRDVDIFTDQTVEAVKELLEHAAFEHSTRREIHVYRTAPLLSGYELGMLMRLPALTDAELKWRDARAGA
ncbi:hypothetical protein SEA_PEPE25_95 [Microbacterium phage Pepe25]|nr:hypothetical protein SEA_PEPE25_95 [Microbacterium phage Pepe25]